MPPRTRSPEPPAEADPATTLTGEAVPTDARQGRPLADLGVAEALAMVARDIGPIAKDRQVVTGPARYSFRGIDDVLDTIHDSMARWGVFFIPTRFDVIDATEGETRSGTKQFHLLGIQHYRIVGPRGDYIDAAVPCEALDLSDKAASKALSMAYKYLAFQVLSIPVRGALAESDSESIERGPAPAGAEVWAKYDAAITSLGMTREEASAKWREQNGGITLADMEALPVERVFGHVRSVVAYARTHAAEKVDGAPVEGATADHQGAGQ
jgi:hypothetical protein